MSTTTFGKYLLDEEIARGGMSRVFLARLRGLGGFEKRLVVKQVLPELASDPRFVSMFVNEAKIVVQMTHPNIAPVYELGVVDGVYFLAMEYIEGATLSEILKSGGALKPELVAHLGIEVCDALHYAHRRFEVVHRDVTPRNVIVDDAGHCRLLDFGIAAPADDETSELFGTPGYISPEQLAGAAVDPQSDVFSLGAVLFEALTKRRAYGGSTIDEARSRLEGDAPSFEGIPKGLAGIVERALARDVADRFESAQALGKALRGWLASRAPEGVGPELGVRADEVETREPAAHDGVGDSVATPGNDVRTLATSHLLDDLLTGARSGATPNTAAIPGRKSLPADAPHTAALPGRASEPSTVALGRAGDTSPSVEAPSDEDPPDGEALDDSGGETSASETSDHETPDEDPPGEEPPGELADPDEAGARGVGDARGPRGIAPPPAAQWRTRGLILAVGIAAAVGFWALRPDTPTPVVDPPRPPPVVLADAGPPDAGPDTRSDTRPDTRPDTGPDAGPDAGRTVPDAARSDSGRAAVAEPSGRASLSVNAVPWGEITVDGRPMGTTPQRALALRAGRHTVLVRCPPLGREATTTITLAPGGRGTVVADLSRDPPTIRAR